MKTVKILYLPLILCLSFFLVSAVPAMSSVQSVGVVLPAGDDAKVTRVINGDTVEVKINDIGFTLGYLGIDATEGTQCYARQAATYNTRLVSGKVIRVEREVSDFDAAGRLLRWIWLPDGRLVNEELVRLGYVTAASVTPDSKYQARLLAAQKIAQDAKYGIWRACPGMLITPTVSAQVSSVACPSPNVCITAPASGTAVYPGSIVVFKGTATDPAFSRYQFMLGNGSAWGHIADFNKPVINGALMGFHTGSVPVGTYTIRLQVIDSSGNTRPEKAEITLTIGYSGTRLAVPTIALPSKDTGTPSNTTRNCCKYCDTGKACGDTCISRTNTCRIGPGCACDK